MNQSALPYPAWDGPLWLWPDRWLTVHERSGLVFIPNAQPTMSRGANTLNYFPGTFSTFDSIFQKLTLFCFFAGVEEDVVRWGHFPFILLAHTFSAFYSHMIHLFHSSSWFGKQKTFRAKCQWQWRWWAQQKNYIFSEWSRICFWLMNSQVSLLGTSMYLASLSNTLSATHSI